MNSLGCFFVALHHILGYGAPHPFGVKVDLEPPSDVGILFGCVVHVPLGSGFQEVTAAAYCASILPDRFAAPMERPNMVYLSRLFLLASHAEG